MKDFKIRCSAIGEIMTQPKTIKAREAGELSVTAMSYMQKWIKENFFDRKKIVETKQMRKGIDVEDSSIELYGEVVNRKNLQKNEDHFENDWCTGTPDLVLENLIVDIKSSWDLFTFPLFDNGIKTKGYWWQLQGYMWLTDRKKAELAYCLTDTPDDIVEQELRYVGEENKDAVMQNMLFGDIDSKYKVKVFAIERDDEAIEQIKEQVEKCRKYQKNLVDLFLK